MAALSSFVEISLINWFKGAAMPIAPSSLEIGLYISDPKDDNSGTEVSGAGYARQVFTFNATDTTVGIGSISKNSNLIVWGPAGELWGNITHWGIFSADTHALLLHGSFTTAHQVLAGGSYNIHPDYMIMTTR